MFFKNYFLKILFRFFFVGLSFYLFVICSKNTILLNLPIIFTLFIRGEHTSDFDRKDVLFITYVIIITTGILVYRVDYISTGSLKIYVLIMFIFSIRILLFISSKRIFTLLLGWDGLGVTSFFLIIYYSNNKSVNARLVTILINRVGDLFLVLCIIIIFVDFYFLLKLNKYMCILFILAAMVKSAQIPFAAWLPIAMAAPTPTSALVHSSTLVTAGVYLLSQNTIIRITQIRLVIRVSIATILIANLSAIFRHDLKTIVALSTLRQMRILFIILCIIHKNIIIIHLLNHASFKSILFLIVGVYIIAEESDQDNRFYSKAHKNYLFLIIFFGTLMGLMGIPFWQAFFSKHLYSSISCLLISSMWILVLVWGLIYTTIFYRAKIANIFLKKYFLKAEYNTPPLIKKPFIKGSIMSNIYLGILVTASTILLGFYFQNWSKDYSRVLIKTPSMVLIFLIMGFTITHLILYDYQWHSILIAWSSQSVNMITLWFKIKAYFKISSYFNNIINIILSFFSFFVQTTIIQKLSRREKIFFLFFIISITLLNILIF